MAEALGPETPVHWAVGVCTGLDIEVDPQPIRRAHCLAPNTRLLPLHKQNPGRQGCAFGETPLVSATMCHCTRNQAEAEGLEVS